MTEEEIKHNAELYTNRYEIRGTHDGEVRYMDKKDAYIAAMQSSSQQDSINTIIELIENAKK